MTGRGQWPRVIEELAFFALAYGIPFVALVLLSTMTSRSPLPLWRRLLTLEDTCPYFFCFIVPVFTYGLARGWRAIRSGPRPPNPS